MQSDGNVGPALSVGIPPGHPPVGIEPGERLTLMRLKRDFGLRIIVDQAGSSKGSGPGPLPFWSRSLSKTVEDVDEFVQLFAPFRLALADAIPDAVVDVIAKDCQADAIKRGLGSRQLLEDFDAQAGFLHHPPDSPDLSLDSVQSCHERLLLSWSTHGAITGPSRCICERRH